MIVFLLLVVNLVLASLTYENQTNNKTTFLSRLDNMTTRSQQVSHKQEMQNFMSDTQKAFNDQVQLGLNQVLSDHTTQMLQQLRNPYRLRHLGNVSKKELYRLKATMDDELLDDENKIDYEPFAAACILCIEDDGEFLKFRQQPAIVDMLEHVRVDQGKEYETIVQHLSEQYNIVIPWKTVCLNDLIGEPETYQIESCPGLSASPTTMRYVVFALRALKQMQDLNSEINIIEIGGGFGGQCCMFFRLAHLFNLKVQSYCILDLAEPNMLQNRYLRAQLPSCDYKKVRCTTIDEKELRKSLSVDSFLFSAYAYSEISQDSQSKYDNILGGLISNGFVVWNSRIQPTSGFYHLIGKVANQVDVIEEKPQTGPYNFLYVF